jgi:hypothetical protein
MSNEVGPMRRLLEDLPVAERLEVYGEIDAGGYGLTTQHLAPEKRWAWLEMPGVETLRDEGREWAPRFADWVLELARPETEPFAPYRLDQHPAVRVPLFVSFARAKRPVERRWEPLFPHCIERPALLRECVEALAAERRGIVLGEVLATFVATHLFPNAPASVDVGAVLGAAADVFAAYPPVGVVDRAFTRYVQGMHKPKREVQAALRAIAKQVAALAPELEKAPAKPPKLRFEPRAWPRALSALERARVAKLDEATPDLLAHYDVVDEAGATRFQALVHAGSDGLVFTPGTADVAAIIAQGGADADDALLCAALESGLAAAAKKAKSTKRKE